jgi:DNA-binding beta-propeller fold protein YncE
LRLSRASSRRHFSLALLVSALFLVVFAASASAVTYEEIGSFAGDGPDGGGTGSGPGELSGPNQADVNDATGNLYVADTGNNRVQVFKPNPTGGEYDSEIFISEPRGLAIDQDSGDVYVANATGIVKYDASLIPILGPAWSDPGVTGTLVVDPSSGDLLVADQGANLIRRFNSDGTPDATTPTFAAERPLDVAANSSGEIFVVTSTGDIINECFSATSSVQRFSSAGTAEGTVGASLPAPGAVAVTPGDDSIVIAARVNEYNCGGQNPFIAFFDSSGTETQSLELTGNARYTTVPGLTSGVFADGSMRVYAVIRSPVSNFYGNTKIVAFEHRAVPLATIGPVVASGASAEFSGTVNPSGYSTDWQFEYSSNGGNSWTATPVENAGAGADPVEVEAAVTGLPVAFYQARLAATNANGPVTSGSRNFVISAVPTVLEEVSASTYKEASLEAKLNPNGLETTYRFEYGPTASYGQVTTSATIQAGVAPVDVSARILGLAEATGYHFRVVASNAEGTSNGDDRTFTTRNADAADTCPNATIRAEQNATGLAECRAYEQITPREKEGVAIETQISVQSAPSGDAIAYAAPGSIGGAPSATRSTYYIGRRGTDGWSAEPIDPPQDNRSTLFATPTRFFSRGLESAMQVSQEALVLGAIDGGSNLYRRNNISGQRSLVAAADGDALTDEMGGIFTPPKVGATPDLSHLVFQSKSQLLPEAAPGVFNVYESVGGDLRLVSVDPQGGVDPGGAQLKTSLRLKGFNPISDDGRRVFFNSPVSTFPQGLYMREDGAVTVPISESQRAGDPPGARPAAFAGASADGSLVYFTSGEQLTEDAIFNGGGNGSLYRYDVESETLTNLMSGVSPVTEGVPDVINVLDVSEDGQSVYFLSGNALTGDAVYGNTNLYLTDADGIRLVANLGSDPSPPSFAASGDSNYLAVVSYSRPTGFDNASPGCAGDPSKGIPAGQCMEVFVYDAASDSLQCATCATSGVGNHHSGIGPQSETISEYVPRAVTDDGRVFVTTGEALVPSDSNGASDVYQWQNGKVALISSGRSPRPSTFVDASPSGRDVFFGTYERLTASDRDDELDLYDARVDGGIAAQNVIQAEIPTCQGEGCQGTLATPPSSIAPGSAAFYGSPSPVKRKAKPRPRCKGKGAKHRKKCATSDGKAHKKARHRKRVATRGGFR